MKSLKSYSKILLSLALIEGASCLAWGNAESCSNEIAKIFEIHEDVKQNFKDFFGDEFFSYRLAAAEVLHRMSLMPRATAHPGSKELLAALRDNAPERIKMSDLPQWRAFLSSVEAQSDLVRRMKTAAHSKRADIPQTVGQALQIEIDKEEVQESKKSSWIPWKKGSENKATSLKHIDYLNVEQFLSYMERFPMDQRLAITESLDRVEIFAHVELFQILAELPLEQQQSVYSRLQKKLVGRVDFFEPSFFEALRDPSTGEVLIDRDILVHELRATGSSYTVAEILHIMDLLDIPAAQRPAVLESGRDFGILYSAAKVSDKLDMTTSEVLLKAMLSKASTLAQAEAALDMMKSKVSAREFKTELGEQFDRWIKSSAFAGVYKLNLILNKKHTETSLIADLTQYVSTVDYGPVETLHLLRYLQGDSVKPMKSKKNKYPEKALLGLRDLIRDLTAKDRPNDTAGTKGWTAMDLVFMEVSFDLDLAVKALQNMKGKAPNAEIIEGIKNEFWRVAQSANLRSIKPGEVTPGKEHMAPPLARKVSPERLIQALTEFAAEKADAATP